MFVSTHLLGQTERDVFHQLGFGITHAAFTNFCFQQPITETKQLQRRETTASTQLSKLPIITELHTGVSMGFFNYLPLGNKLALRTKLEGSFSTNYIYQNKPIYYTALGFNVTQQCCMALKKANEHGIIYLARNMSCYLTYKQPYISFGPIISVQKFDDGFLNKGFNNELCFGASIGYGINYEFHGTNVAPEINYQITSTAQNKISDKNKICHSISLSINLF